MSQDLAAQALSASQQALDFARAQAWAPMAQAIAKRDEAIGSLSLHDAGIESTLVRLHTENEQLTAIVGMGRDDLAKALGRQRATHRALAAYIHNT